MNAERCVMTNAPDQQRRFSGAFFCFNGKDDAKPCGAAVSDGLI